MNDLTIDCLACLEKHPFFCYGSELSPKSGFWRIDIKSSKFIACPNKLSCLGDLFYRERFPKGIFEGLLEEIISLDASFEISINSKDFLSKGYCLKGYSGVLCLECEKGFGVSAKFDCQKCGELFEIMKKITLSIFRIFVFWISIQKAFTMNKSVSKEFSQEVKKDVYSCYFLKILTQHFQILFLLQSLPLEFPSLLKSPISFFVLVAAPDFQTIFSAECLLKGLGLRISVHYFRLMLISSLNFLILLIFVLISFKKNSNLKKNKKKEAETQNKSIDSEIEFHYKNPLLVIFDIYLIDVVAQVQPFLENFDCLEISDEKQGGKGQLVLLQDIKVNCSSISHQYISYYLSLPFIIFVGLLLPFIVCARLLIAKWRKNLESENMLLKFGYFYFTYDREKFFYEIFVFLKKICFLLMQIYFNFVLIGRNGEVLNTCFLLLIYLLVFYAIFTYYRPYNKSHFSKLNHFEGISYKIQILSTNLAIFLVVDDGGLTGNIFKILIILVLISSKKLFSSKHEL